MNAAKKNLSMAQSAHCNSVVRGLAAEARAVRARLYLQPRGAIGHLAGRVVRGLRRECDALHRAGLERDFLATEKGTIYRASGCAFGG